MSKRKLTTVRDGFVYPAGEEPTNMEDSFNLPSDTPKTRKEIASRFARPIKIF